MRKINNSLVYSPSDLINFIESPFASWMDRALLEGLEGVEPDEENEERQLVAEEGNKHEAEFLESIIKEGRKVFKVEPKGRQPIEDAKDAIKRKEEVVFQATLELGNFRGNADFLFYNADEDLYEVWDTKLARKSKPYFIIQLCCYSEMLAAVQGRSPKKWGLFWGMVKRMIIWSMIFMISI